MASVKPGPPGPRHLMADPEAATKLRLVLDYLPCEACLAVPTQEQELLCTLCARLDRQVTVRAATKTRVILERPEPEAPVIVEPAPGPVAMEASPPAADEPAEPEVAPEPIEAPLLPVRFVADGQKPGVGPAIEVVLERVVTAVPEVDWEDDLYSWEEPDDPYGVAGYTAPAPAFGLRPAPADEAAEEPLEAVEAPEDSRPPEFEPEAEPARPAEPAALEAPPVDDEPLADEDFVQPDEEVVVEPDASERSPWAPPEDDGAHEPANPLADDFLADEGADEEILESVPVEDDEDIVESIPVEDEEDIVESIPVDDDIVESVPVENDEEIVESIPVDDDDDVIETTPLAAETASDGERRVPATSDLHRLHGFDEAVDRAFAAANLLDLEALNGRNPNDISAQTHIAPEMAAMWIATADLVLEVGVPLEAAQSLAHAGILGPASLADADIDETVARVSAAGGRVTPSELKRWQRRA